MSLSPPQVDTGGEQPDESKERGKSPKDTQKKVKVTYKNDGTTEEAKAGRACLSTGYYIAPAAPATRSVEQSRIHIPHPEPLQSGNEQPIRSLAIPRHYPVKRSNRSDDALHDPSTGRSME